MDLQTIGRIIQIAGISMLVLGALLWLGGRMGLGTLPGDIRLNGAGWGCYVSIATSILLSLLLTVVLNLLLRFFNK
ncbi:MAG: DUF2905 family protein [Coriobacteriia bacterium]|nr:DUF2905 family protein [Coriobacteriia bacterium]